MYEGKSEYKFIQVDFGSVCHSCVLLIFVGKVNVKKNVALSFVIQVNNV